MPTSKQIYILTYKYMYISWDYLHAETENLNLMYLLECNPILAMTDALDKISVLLNERLPIFQSNRYT